MSDGCGAPVQTAKIPANVDIEKETVLAGKVLAGDDPVGGAFVRLLDGTGEFTAEVVSSPDGDFLFFAGNGEWTLRTLAPAAETVDRSVEAAVGSVAEVTITL